jgi:hypothetical protein
MIGLPLPGGRIGGQAKLPAPGGFLQMQAWGRPHRCPRRRGPHPRRGRCRRIPLRMLHRRRRRSCVLWHATCGCRRSRAVNGLGSVQL